MASSLTFAQLLEPVRPFVNRVESSLDQVPPQRRLMLQQVAEYVASTLAEQRAAKLVFICTHNSRRSHLAQVWCQVAAAHYQLSGIETFSGGTETTACNVRTVHSLRRAGLSVVASVFGENPLYLIQFAEDHAPLKAYSKLIAADKNPTTGFAALMCCSTADESCPVVSGADVRFALHYLDPKIADNTAGESQTYDARSFQIAKEMFCLMSAVARLRTAKPAAAK